MQAARVQTLVREQRSHMLHRMAKKKKKLTSLFKTSVLNYSSVLAVHSKLAEQCHIPYFIMPKRSPFQSWVLKICEQCLSISVDVHTNRDPPKRPWVLNSISCSFHNVFNFFLLCTSLSPFYVEIITWPR